MKSNIRKTTVVISFFAVITAAFLFVCLSGCNQNSQQNNTNNEPIVGQWETKWKSTQQANSQEKPAIFSINSDGNAYWMTLANSPGYQIAGIVPEKWTKEGDNTYTFTNSNNDNYKFEFNKEADTLISSNYGRTYTRLDPIVGIWTGKSSQNTGGGNNSTIIKSDGTGIDTIAFDDGTVDVYNLTWNMNSDKNYEVTLDNGMKRTYKISEDGKSLTTDDGRSKTKCFADSYFLVSVVGAWYCPEKNYSVVYNADGTGFGNYNGKKAYSFTWEISKNGVEVTCKDGVDKNGNDVTGKTFTWTYNREDNSLSSSSGTKYIRPTSSIPGLITFK